MGNCPERIPSTDLKSAVWREEMVQSTATETEQRRQRDSHRTDGNENKHFDLVQKQRNGSRNTTEPNGTQQKQKEKHSKKTRSLKLEGTSENKPPLKKLIFIIDFCWMDSYCSASNSTNDWWEKTTTCTCTCPVCKSLSEMHGHLWYFGTAVTFKENERTKASWVYVLFLPARQQKFA